MTSPICQNEKFNKNKHFTNIYKSTDDENLDDIYIYIHQSSSEHRCRLVFFFLQSFWTFPGHWIFKCIFGRPDSMVSTCFSALCLNQPNRQPPCFHGNSSNQCSKWFDTIRHFLKIIWLRVFTFVLLSVQTADGSGDPSNITDFSLKSLLCSAIGCRNCLMIHATVASFTFGQL